MKTCLLALLLPFALSTAPLAAQQPPGPMPQHEKLQEHAGTWDAVMEFATPDGQKGQAKGVSIQTVAFGGLWLSDEFTADIMGMPFQGRGTTGFDPKKGKYVGSWIDSLSPMLMVLEGEFDAAGKVLTMTGMGIDHTGEVAKHRMVTTRVDATTMRFEMFVTGKDGKEVQTMTITYTKRPVGQRGEKDKPAGR